MPKSKHLDRKDLIKAVLDSEKDWPDHLRSCPECLELVELLKTYRVDGILPLEEPPAGWAELAAEIPSRSGTPRPAGKLLARLIFDSWTSPDPVGVRGTGTETERRLHFEAEGINFDMRAERRQSDWIFVARIKAASELSEPILLMEGNKHRKPDALGLIQWSTSRPPSEISLRVGDTTVQIPRFSWKKPRVKKPKRS